MAIATIVRTARKTGSRSYQVVSRGATDAITSYRSGTSRRERPEAILRILGTVPGRRVMPLHPRRVSGDCSFAAIRPAAVRRPTAKPLDVAAPELALQPPARESDRPA